MNTIARLNDGDRKFIFLKTSEATGKSVAIVEKDYWISYLNSLVHVRDEKVSLYRHFQNFSSHDSAI